MEQFHEKIRRLRTEKNVTQKAMAEQVGIRQCFLSDIELNRRMPSTETMVKFAAFFEISVRELLTDVVVYKWDLPWQLIPEPNYMDMVLEE